MKAKLTRINSNHDRLRDDIIEGDCQNLPRVGSNFVLIAPPRDTPDGFRYVETTPISKINKLGPGKTEFHTRNSVYHLEILD